MTLLFISFGFAASAADAFRREVTLDWDPIPGAKSYEVQIQRNGEKKLSKSLRSEEASWKGQLALGHYTLRVRGSDKRRVPGSWSTPLDFDVTVETPVTTGPKPAQKITSNSKTQEVNFQWQAVKGAIGYQVQVQTLNGKSIGTEKTSKTSLKMELPTATEFQWKVQALAPENMNSPVSADSQFTVLGPALDPPEIQRPPNSFVRSISWAAPPPTSSYDYVLARKDPKTGDWVLKDRKNDVDATKLPFPGNWPGGEYKISLRAKSPLYATSRPAELKFDVSSGSRTPAAEEQAMLRDAIDPTTGWFGIASYLVTGVTYQGTNSDHSPGQPLNVTLNSAIGGTGRLGAGYLGKESPWGFLSIFDYSGISVNSNIINYSSLEADAIYRSIVGSRGELRQLMGLFYKQYPNLIPNPDSSINSSLIGAIGPHYGLEYWYSMSRTFGLQVNAHAYYNMDSLSTPNGSQATNSLSYQLGFLGSYRLSPRITGLIGYAFRNDSISYPSNDGNTNTSSVTGNYLNLFLEWSL